MLVTKDRDAGFAGRRHFAEVTLHYRDKAWQTCSVDIRRLSWPEYMAWFERVRSVYVAGESMTRSAQSGGSWMSRRYFYACRLPRSAETSLVLTAAAVHYPRIGFTDHPGGHQIAQGTCPTAVAWQSSSRPGAVAATISTAAGWSRIGASGVWRNIRPYLGGLEQRSGQALVLLIGAAVLHVLGLIDDVRALGAYPKLIVIAGVGLLVTVWGGLRIGAMWGDAVSIPLTVAWFIVIVNAFNFLDNMDGLSSGVGWLCLVSLAACGLMAGQVFVPALACIFIGAVLGFWFFNFPPARIFMGDAGSLVVGYMLATTAVMTTYFRSGMDAPPYALAMPLVILAVPLYDFVSVVGIRLAEPQPDAATSVTFRTGWLTTG